jgi:hypothetical protein
MHPPSLANSELFGCERENHAMLLHAGSKINEDVLFALAWLLAQRCDDEIPHVVPGVYAVTVYAGAKPIEKTVELTGSRTEVDVTRQ